MSSITLTFGDRGENGVGMQIIGKASREGYTLEDLRRIGEKFPQPELYHLGEDAYVLVLKKGLDFLLPRRVECEEGLSHLAKLLLTLIELPWDRKCWMRGRVVNKQARWNLCFMEDVEQEPDYKEKKGRIIKFSSLPLLDELKRQIYHYFEEEELICEGNYYYDINKCGIGFHGDGERRKVIGVRLGASHPLYFQWYKEKKEVGAILEIPLENGDIYVMSDKAVGHDWKKSKDGLKTLRHAAGSSKYTGIK